MNNIFFLGPQPEPDDNRPRNAFGVLKGFGKAASEYYDKKYGPLPPAIAHKLREEIMFYQCVCGTKIDMDGEDACGDLHPNNVCKGKI